MVLYCAALDCKSNGFDVGISFHKFPKEEKLKKIWLDKIQRWAMTISDNTVLCSKHFMDADYVNPNHKRRRLVAEAVPTVFAWTKVIPEKRRFKRDYSKINNSKLHAADNREKSENTFTNVSSTERFGVAVMRHKNELIQLYTGFQNYQHFHSVFRFLVPNDSGDHIKYFTVEDEGCSVNGETESLTDVLNLEDQFLMTMMKFRLALPNADLAFRFNLTNQQAAKILTTWINYMYIRFASVVAWPPRSVIVSNSPKTFVDQHPGVVAAVTGVQMSVNSSRLTSKNNAIKGCKCVLVCDPNGSVLFTSQMYEDSASYKDIVSKCGLLRLLKMLVDKGYLLQGDTLMVDSNFDMQIQLESLGLKCDSSTNEDDGPTVKCMAAMRMFLLFDGRPFPIEMLDLLDQMWSCVCFLTSLIPVNSRFSSEIIL